MCGRCACSFEPETLGRACQYQDARGNYRKASWIPSKFDEIQYVPGSNMGPRSILPILTSGFHLKNDEERVICPMLWGMIPPWHQGDYKKHKVSSHNARLEGVHSSKLYSPSLRQGRRCIAVVEGFYEWKRSGADKQPYYIYSKQRNNFKVEDKSSWPNDWSEETGWQGQKLLNIAGIFNTFKTVTGDTVLSFSMLTTESNQVLSWLHDRAPVFLTTEADVQSWLDFENVSMEKALENVRGLSVKEEALSWHPVSKAVNSISYQNDDCIKPIKLEIKEEAKKGPTGLMASWLKGESNKRKSNQSENSANAQEKKIVKKND